MPYRTDYTVRTAEGGLEHRTAITAAPLTPDQVQVMAGGQLVMPTTPAPTAPAPAPAEAPAPAAAATTPTSAPPSAWWSLVPAAGAVAGTVGAAALLPEALPMAAVVGAKALGSGLGAGVAETAASLTRGEPVGQALTQGAKTGAIAAATDPLAQGLVAAVKPAARFLGGQLAPVAESLGVLEPVLAARQTLKSTADTAVQYATRGGEYLRSAAAPLFQAQRGVVDELPIAADTVAGAARSALDAVKASGATPAQRAEFASVVAPFTGKAPPTYGVAVGRERQLANWLEGLRASGAPQATLDAVDQLHGALGGELNRTAAGTAGEAARAAYVQTQNQVMPTRLALASFRGAPGADVVEFMGTNPSAVEAMLANAGQAERDALATTWVNGVRQKAGGAADPSGVMAEAYGALPASSRALLFGERQAAFEQVLGAAGQSDVAKTILGAGRTAGLGGLGYFLGLPGAATSAVNTVREGLNLAAGPVARRAVASPEAAGGAFGAGLGRAAAPVIDWTQRAVSPLAHATAQRAGQIVRESP